MKHKLCYGVTNKDTLMEQLDKQGIDYDYNYVVECEAERQAIIDMYQTRENINSAKILLHQLHGRIKEHIQTYL